MNEGKTSGRSKVARLAALGTAVALLGVSLGVSIPAANAQATGGSNKGKVSMSSKAHKGGKVSKAHKGGKKGKKGSGGTTTAPPK